MLPDGSRIKRKSYARNHEVTAPNPARPGNYGALTYLAIMGLLLLFRYAIDFMVAGVGNTEWTFLN